MQCSSAPDLLASAEATGGSGHDTDDVGQQAEKPPVTVDFLPPPWWSHHEIFATMQDRAMKS